MLQAENLTAFAAVRHAFFTREGGVSDGLYSSLNCGLGSGDDPGRVRENRRRAAARLGVAAETLVTARQVHSARVVVVDRPWEEDARPEADALVTRTPGVALSVLTADCAPVLLADADAAVVAAVHAGWRGARAGILAATVAAMQQLGARRERIAAAIGPCIRQPSYQVGHDLFAEFTAGDPASARFFLADAAPGKHRFDLAGFVDDALARAEVGSRTLLPHDTLADPERFFSFRRTTQAGEKAYGRMLSAVALAG